MKLQGMSNKGKTLFKKKKDKIENFSRMSLRLQPVIGLDGRFFCAKRGLKRKGGMSLLSSCSSPEMELYFP